jgi:hypothetical protein
MKIDNSISTVYYQQQNSDKSAIVQDAAKKEVQDSKDSEFDPKLQELKTIDSRVRAHEAAHLAAGGGVVTGGASFSYERGSDGKMYAVGGEVPIDSGEANTPEATIAKAQQILAAAMAPADPSPQDYRVASSAVIMEMKAKADMLKEQQEKLEGVKAYGEDAKNSTSSSEQERQDLDKTADTQY